MKEDVLNFLRSRMGDDLERAEMAFRGFSEEKLRQMYGRSGESCQEILDKHRAQRAHHLAMIKWVEDQP